MKKKLFFSCLILTVLLIPSLSFSSTHRVRCIHHPCPTISLPDRFRETETPTRKPKDRLVSCNKFTFDASGSYDVHDRDLSFHWDFGDGNTSTEPIVEHIYQEGGEYEVVLTVTNDSGLECDTATTSQTVKVNAAPIVAFSLPEVSCVGHNITFDASETRDPTSDNLTYFWEFGDGTRKRGEIVNHSYKKGGDYEVTLTVDDNENTDCSIVSISNNIHINTLPIADAGEDIMLCTESFYDDYIVNLDASKSRDVDGKELKYFWDLGDGNTAEGKIVTHTYDKGGEYRVNLTVDDQIGSACSIAKDSIKLILNKPPVAKAIAEKTICINTPAFFDGSNSLTEEGEQLSYNWDFGDGNKAEGKTVRHTYKKGGDYTVRLVVNDGRNTKCSEDTDELKLHINSRPTAKLRGPEIESLKNEIEFDASCSSHPDDDSLTYLWDFGDGTRKEAGNIVKHKFYEGGNYKVTVKVDDGKGYPCSTHTDSINIRINTPPVAISGPNIVCCVNTKSIFDASKSYDPDGDTLTYFWEFGDGNTSEGKKVTHIYTEPGIYKVTLTVDDGTGTEYSTDTTSFVANVEAEPVPVMRIKQN